MPSRGTVRFVYGGRLREISAVDPTLTVLRWLREHEHKTGTKEGCAEGDCGACTVAVGELDGDGIRYRAVNACIQFLPTLDGKVLVTVEDLKGGDGELHPAQQAMVDTNASQCGFCTPGFVMSLFVLGRETRTPSRPEIHDALAGNLCRCTGYGPIIEAAATMAATAGSAGPVDREADTISLLRSIENDGPLAVAGGGTRYFAPRTIADLEDVLDAHPEATILAGGTDVGLWVTKQHRRLETLVYLGQIDELSRIEIEDDWTRMGAAVTYTDAFDALGRVHPDLGELTRRLGARQIRNLGTIVGNIANGSPIGDMPPALIALDATIRLRRKGEVRDIPLEDFFIAYGKQDRRAGEFVESVRFRPPRASAHFRAYKLSKRLDQDISAVCGAFLIDLEDGVVTGARICFGGMAAAPKRASKCEDFLIGKPWTEATVSAAQEIMETCYAPLSDMRGSAAYRMSAARNLLMKCFVETSTPMHQTRVLEAGEWIAHG
ncbi:MAG: xanthine dehydrogenase small subunit [Alphaproteobacteria bacterium]|nr:MAG: xanthine dehydrogenase small subunit [Alphaproteobacteria bacterium]